MVHSVIVQWLEFLFLKLKVFLLNGIFKKVTNYLYIVRRDTRFMLTCWKALRRVRRYDKENITIVHKFQTVLKSFLNKPCLYFEDTVWTFKDVENYSNKVCSLFAPFIDKGDVVALFIPNRPEYACIWLGCAKVGIITSLINTNLRKKPLLHSINLSKPKVIIYSNQFETVLSEIIDEIEGDPKLYSFEGGSKIMNSENFEESLNSALVMDKIPDRKLTFKDVVLYIHTSGTTGLPKPSNITHSKLTGLALAIENFVGIKEDDIIYTAMPMYHVACTASVVTAFTRGPTVILRSKFSASSFISDCRKYNATAAQYIGEMLRYVLNTPTQPDDTNHKLRVMAGNGITADVWRRFIDRFKVEQIVEYYGATECNFSLLNNENEVGCCGFLPIGIPFYHLLGPSIIRIDDESGQPLRNKRGFCTLVKPNETGLAIGYCPVGSEMRKFHGYVDKSDTNSKILRNVFKMGDSAYNTGDLMIMDDCGWVTFVDRLGDTFRWKGENVSTTEVESILKDYQAIEDCAVYGVQVGNLEGKAGMAALKMKKVDVESFSRFVELSLPPYAQPIFLRLVDTLQYTSTFKVVKTNLKKQAFNISLVTDPLLIKLNNEYTPLTKDIYQQILQGNCKLKL